MLPAFLFCLCWGSRHVVQVLAATIRWWLTELIVKDFSLRMQECPVCPALISTYTTSLTWNYRWHWINTNQHLMFYHISCKISLTTGRPVQNLLEQAVFDVDLSTVNGSQIPVKCFMLVIRTIAVHLVLRATRSYAQMDTNCRGQGNKNKSSKRRARNTVWGKPVWGWSGCGAETRGDRCCIERILSRRGQIQQQRTAGKEVWC